MLFLELLRTRVIYLSVS